MSGGSSLSQCNQRSIERSRTQISSEGEFGDPVPGFDIEAEGIDDEIREIFLEEFNEEYENVT